MKNFHGNGRTSSFFEGWYLKHQKGTDVLAFIPGMQVGPDGKKEAFIQIITDQKSYYLPFAYTQFKAHPSRFAVCIGKSVFSERGVKLDIDTPEVRCTGTVHYGAFVPPKTPMMGPFALKSMQCNHEILSLYHPLRGRITLNGRTYELSGGSGYIEKDWGTSFPKEYLWMQCGGFLGRDNCVMASVADVPVGRGSFLGCICSVYYQDREYRLATYRGARVLYWDSDGLFVKQGSYRLMAEVLKQTPQELRAPQFGAMSRTIREGLCCRARVSFYVGTRKRFDFITERASFEYVTRKRL
ncbi:tocopherol cyclase family protein [Candidatus Soleaferrea massiliensis]|uniref:tocopherol cyclase family protein n=1 Tax=Candidatus Soleaferrea massiliensis TaxID=1470354 RepID=UPI000693D1B6|nr:tocopherol cyclase family protein [Candidatus Soleaferrea massiliensis]